MDACSPHSSFSLLFAHSAPIQKHKRTSKKNKPNRKHMNKHTIKSNKKSKHKHQQQKESNATQTDEQKKQKQQ